MSSMGNLLGNWRFKEPSTVEECDSTWGSDSESDEPAAEDDSGISESASPAESEWPAGNNGDLSPKVRGGGSFRWVVAYRAKEWSTGAPNTFGGRPRHKKGQIIFHFDIT